MFGWVGVCQGSSWLEQFYSWLRDVALQYSYFGVFVASFVGAASVVVPVPYTVLIFMLGKVLDPVLLAFSAGAGASLGEFFGYFMGYYGRAVISDERRRKVDYLLRVFRRYGALTIFLFALTPLPDDLLFIPLGIMRYSFVRAFLPCILGKIVMSLILAYGGRFSIGFIEAIFGGEENSLLVMVVTSVLLVVVIVVMLRVDWEKIFPLKED
ncbi:MAG: VTT domain-containing protein [Nitrososphaerota archaeon]